MAKGSSCKTCDSATCSAKEQREEESLEEFLERQALAERLCKIRHKLLVLSGKGGVGKSTVAANLAVAFAGAGLRTGLLDIDLHGPSIPKLLHLEGSTLDMARNAMEPVAVELPSLSGRGNGEGLAPAPIPEPHPHPALSLEGRGVLRVISIGFLLRSADDAVIWRGPLKMGVIKQFLRDVEWGELDYLVVDSPPGTGDEPLSICQLMPEADGAVVVTTPQDVSVTDVRKCITFCRQVKMPVLGVVENMSGFVCPHCGKTTDLFKSGGGERMAAEMGVPFLGRIPIDPAVVESGDDGRPVVSHYADSPSALAFARIAETIRERTKENRDAH